MDWFHRVNAEWLAARKNYLCASDIQRLLPTTPTGRKRANLTEAYLGVWGEKQCAITDSDIMSRGAMARGHILEAYAVTEINEQQLLPKKFKTLYHWDDTMVVRNGISCSPDALNIRHGVDYPHVLHGADATFVGEIKSYAAAKHYEVAAAPVLELTERWQLATAFYVMPTVEVGALIFYNPSAAHPLFIRRLRRAALAAELEAIDEIREAYAKMALEFETSFAATCATADCRPEADIIAELERLQAEGLNPR